MPAFLFALKLVAIVALTVAFGALTFVVPWPFSLVTLAVYLFIVVRLVELGEAPQPRRPA